MDRSFLVLTASAGVGDEAARAARAGLSAAGVVADPPRRLATTALEIGFSGALPNGFDVRALVPETDANVVPAERRRKRLLLADMDSTIIGVESIDEMAAYAGVGDAVAKVTEAAMRGELDFEGALLARLALLRGLPETVLARAYAERVRLNPGAEVLARTMNALGALTALVSGGFTYFAERVAAEAGFARTRANRLAIEAGVLTGEVERPILGRSAKRETLASLAAELGIAEVEAVAVGDGANDLDMVQAAGLGVAYRAKPALAERAAARLDRSDLTATLALQGIHESEWAEPV